VPYEVIAGPNGDARVKIPINGKTYTPQEISAMILGKLKTDAEAYLGEPVTQAVITVPAYFNDAQRQATKDAGKIAGLEVLRIINEPTAAALAYGLDKKNNETILVFDLGGGTFDVSVLEVGEGVVEVKATNGDTHLGGYDWDQAIVNWVSDEFKRDQGIDLRADRQALQRLREASEKAKIELSSTSETELNLPFITADASGPKHLNYRLSRAKFEQLTDDLLKRTRGPFEAVLRDAGLAASQLNEIVLVGGATRMPMVQEMVRQLGGKEPHKGVNPDEVVAIGAAIQAGVLGGDVKDVLLLDVTPLSLGLETLGGVMTSLIERNTTIPVKKSQIFSTAAENQGSVEVHVLQGERPLAKDNVSLGKFILDVIPPAPRGVPQIEVSFDLDANGILHVGAKDLGTGKEQSIRISSPSKLSKDEVEKFVKQAEQFSEEDKKHREEIEAKNELDGLVYATEKSLKEHGDKISGDERLAIDRALSEAKEALKGGQAEAMRKAKEELMAASHKLAETIYKAAANKTAGGGGAAPQDGGGKPEGEAVDAEVVDEGKK